MMLVNGLVAATLVAAVDLEEWFDAGRPLNSTELLDLVPLANNPGFGTDRFSLEHISQLFLWRPTDPVKTSFDFDQFTQTHGDSPQSLFNYGDMLYYGVNGARNLTKAMAYYQRAADQGHGDAQFMVGLAHSTGLFGNFPQNQALATMYYTFSALNHSVRGLMAMGQRYLTGLHTPKDYSMAYNYLMIAAEQCLEYYDDFPGIGSKFDPFYAYILADEFDGGIYGKLNRRELLVRTPLRELLSEFDSIQEGLDYLNFHAYDEGAARPLQFLAQAHQYGAEKGVADFDSAAACAEELIARTNKDQSKRGRALNAWGHAFLGECHRRGQGRPFDIEAAREYYNTALQVANPTTSEQLQGKNLKMCPQCYNGLGKIALYDAHNMDPSSPPEEIAKRFDLALRHFQNGTFLSNPYSQYYVAHDLVEKGHLDQACKLLESCHDIIPNAAFLLGEIYQSFADVALTDAASASSCKKAAQEMSLACQYTEEFHSPIRWAQTVYPVDQDAALLGYLVGAEMGYTAMQMNVADILDVQHSSFEETWANKWPVPSYVHEESRAPLALNYYTSVGHVFSRDALYKAADYYYYGYGTETDPFHAATIYQVLSRNFMHPMSNWALGWMHEHGVGVSKDFHLAKRYYDTALYFKPEAYISVKLNLVVLYIKGVLARWTGNEPALPPQRATSQSQNQHKSWRQAFLEAKKKLEVFRQAELLEDGQAEDYETAALMVDISIIIAVFVIFATLVWFRRRNNNNLP